jgi:hypothetical protein
VVGPSQRDEDINIEQIALHGRPSLERMDFTVEEVKGSASAGTEKTGKPDLLRRPWLEVTARPFLASWEITSPAVLFVVSAISLAAFRTASSISKVVLIVLSS